MREAYVIAAVGVVLASPLHAQQPQQYPIVGRWDLTVTDSSPQPGAGQANYIVTAVSDGTQRRYGRRRIGGVMSGRDPALLPGCP